MSPVKIERVNNEISESEKSQCYQTVIEQRNLIVFNDNTVVHCLFYRSDFFYLSYCFIILDII